MLKDEVFHRLNKFFRSFDQPEHYSTYRNLIKNGIYVDDLVELILLKYVIMLISTHD